MSKAGALFDLLKLTDISKTYISTLSADEVFDSVLAWAEEYNPAFAERLTNDSEYAHRIFAIERGNEKPRKDIAKWEDVPEYIEYFYSRPTLDELPENLSGQDMLEIISEYKNVYSADETAEEWFPKVRDMSEKLGYAKAPKFYKKNPDEFKGHVGDVSTVLRVAVTGRRNTPDLYQIFRVLGYDEVMQRLSLAEEKLKDEN